MLHDGLSQFLASSRTDLRRRPNERVYVPRTQPSEPAADLISFDELRRQSNMTSAELSAALDGLERRGLISLTRYGDLIRVRLTSAGLGRLAESEPSG